MKEKVVFILGAGFSAPLGLPVMSNFLSKSKDMYFSNPEKYSYFEEIFATINRLSIIKNYFSSDLFNIEEILSILEMDAFLDDKRTNTIFTKYIADVIEYYTPKLPHSNANSMNWYDFIYPSGPLRTYGSFIMSLLGLSVTQRADKTYEVKFVNLENSYSIVTLNYDRIPEILIEHAQNCFDFKEGFVLPIYKLHGCVGKGNIIPPTWNKGNQHGIEDHWKGAFQELKNANHIRIIGYSLPESDSYIKYLLKSAIAESKHLKTIDIICYEKGDTARKRYNDFISFDKLRYKNANIETLMQNIKTIRDKATNNITCGRFEIDYSIFMSQ